MITMKTFESHFGTKLGENYERALNLFKESTTEFLQTNVVNALLHAAGKNKVKEILDIMEKHFRKHLNFQHPEIRGTVAHIVTGNPTERVFLDIYQNVLGLKPNQPKQQ